ncbi:TPA: hypothetical protein ACFNMI_000855 [Neisseria bacilliformis]|uniref:Uncharacterized protein n=1 Tax=Neisseria bacilliformis ATCC BAA-1200 TaxID=888742 RepID=F2BAJ3_9NEIS|nr:hypothetical protein [Neisseria bacilliformis]EGF11580.1 hypothetical protein HMPREF9123_0696 [Neisseria bacilliformis ATCC BAA-1200]
MEPSENRFSDGLNAECATPCKQNPAAAMPFQTASKPAEAV